MHYLYFSISLTILSYFLFTKNEKGIFFFIIQGILLDILSIQLIGNISLLKLTGFLSFPYILLNYSFKDFIKLKIFNLFMLTIIAMLISYIVFNFVFPWESEFEIHSFRTNIINSTKNFLTHISEFGCILFLAIFFNKKNEFRTIIIIICAISICGILLEKVCDFDFFHHFSGGPKMLLKMRARGFSFEPRSASYYMAIIISVLSIYNFSLPLKLLLLTITTISFIFTNSMTGYVILLFSLIIIGIISVIINKKQFKSLLIIVLPLIFVATFILSSSHGSNIIKHIKSRAYIFTAEKVIDKLEYADAAALNFFIKNPKYIIFGNGVGLASVATSKYLPENSRTKFKNGLTYLPFMGIMLILTNGGIILFSIYLAIIWTGLLEIYQLDIDKDKRDFILTITVVFIATYFIQVRYFHILGFAIMLYAEMKNKNLGTTTS